MFPSYIFCRISDSDRHHLLMDPGVLNFVFWLGKPAVVRDDEIEAVKKIANHGDEVKVEANQLEKGQFVKIPEGPFRGLDGIVDKIDKRKVLVFVEQLGCVVSFKYSENE